MPRIVWADILRGLASIAVYNSHTVSLMRPELRTTWESLTAIYPIHIICCRFAVQIFFVLSGYVLTKSYWQRNSTIKLVSQWGKRWLRLYLMVALSYGFCWLLFYCNWYFSNDFALMTNYTCWNSEHFIVTNTDWTISRMVLVGFSLENWHANRATWTMESETYGSYITIAASFLIKNSRMKNLTSLQICILFGGLAYIAYFIEIKYWHLYACMFGGAALANVHVSSCKTKLILQNRLFLIGSAIPTLYALGIPYVVSEHGIYYWAIRNQNFLWFVSIVSSLLFVNIIAFSEVYLSAKPWFDRLGEMTYPMYLVHYPFLMSISSWLSIQTYNWGPYMSFATTFFLTSLLVFPVFYFVSKIDLYWMAYLNSIF